MLTSVWDVGEFHQQHPIRLRTCHVGSPVIIDDFSAPFNLAAPLNGCVLGPLHQLELHDSRGSSHRHSSIFAAVSPTPQRPAFSGRFANGHLLVSSGLNFLISSARSFGVKPL